MHVNPHNIFQHRRTTKSLAHQYEQRLQEMTDAWEQEVSGLVGGVNKVLEELLHYSEPGVRVNKSDVFRWRDALAELVDHPTE